MALRLPPVSYTEQLRNWSERIEDAVRFLVGPSGGLPGDLASQDAKSGMLMRRDEGDLNIYGIVVGSNEAVYCRWDGNTGAEAKWKQVIPVY